MRSIDVVIVIAFVTHAYAKELAANHTGHAKGLLDAMTDKLVDKLVGRTLNGPSFDRKDLENTAIGKPSHVALKGLKGQRLPVFLRPPGHLATQPPLFSALRPLQVSADTKSVTFTEEQLLGYKKSDWTRDKPTGDGFSASVPDAFKYVSMILNAKVYDVCKQTDLNYAPKLSADTGNRVLLKREDQQPIYSFKLRGAYNTAVSLSPEDKAKGICACSAGNHAQGIAFSALKLGISAKIFMPKTTPKIKVNAAEAMLNEQSEVILTGNSYDEAYAATLKCIEEEGRVLVHPFNDPMVIAGQGTIGQEILTQSTKENIDTVFCCVGGGGLCAGIGVFLKSVKPDIKVIGVEAIDSAAMTESLKAGKVVDLPFVGQFADGAAVKKVGDETFRICQAVVDEMITVSTEEICAAIKDSFIDTRVVMEPAGALAVAGMKQYAERTKSTGKTFVCVTSGANMDFDRLRFVSERADTSETLIAVRIPETPGAFIELYRNIYPRAVTEFSYRISGDPANIFMSFQASSATDRSSVLDALDQAGYSPLDLGDNELAKTHLRHLTGGRAPAEQTTEEALFRFEFPERPGSLLRFLESLPSDINVSLFHYRSHGADVARVLVGLQVPKEKREKLREYLDFLSSQGYSWCEETDNLTYGQFLLNEGPREKNPSITQTGRGNM